MLRNSTSVSTKQERIAALAKQSPLMAFTSLAHLMDIDWLKEAYRRTRKDGAAGVDGVTADEYEQDLEDVPEEIKKEMKFVFVDTVDDVIKSALEAAKKSSPTKSSSRTKKAASRKTKGNGKDTTRRR